jgi:hypothetical protein
MQTNRHIFKRRSRKRIKTDLTECVAYSTLFGRDGGFCFISEHVEDDGGLEEGSVTMCRGRGC